MPRVDLVLSRTIGRTVSDVFGGLWGQSLKTRCVRSSIVLSMGTVVAKGLNFGSKVILARILVPQEFGLMVLITSITSLFEAFTEIGVKQSIIQNKNGSQSKYLSTAWWFQSLRALGLYIIAFLFTPLLCRFYFIGRPEIMAFHTNGELLALVRVAFLAILFSGFASARVHILEKEFRFGKAMVLSQGSNALGAVITIVLAVFMRNVWALVIGFASTGLIGCLLSYIICPFRPELRFDRTSFRDISRYARGIVGLPILTYIALNIDVLVGGKMVSADRLGMYGFAFSLAQIPKDLFGRIIAPILLPAFAQKQDDKKAICRTILKITKYVAFFTVPLVTLASVYGKQILSLVYRPEFSAVAVPFGFLCVYILFLTQSTILGNVLFGIGLPSKHRFFVGLRVLIIAGLIYPAIRVFGLAGAAATLMFANFISMVAQTIVLRKVIGLRIREYTMSWVPGIALAVLTLATIWFLNFI